MNESKGFSMQCLSSANCKTVFDKLFVLIEYGSFYNFITSISFIIEYGVPDIFHVNTDLVRAAGFQYAFNQCYISKSFEHFIMRNGFLSMMPIWESLK